MCEGKTTALVKVGNPYHLGVLERRFEVIRRYPFIRSVAISCNYEDARRLSDMREVEYVCSQTRVSALDYNVEKISESESRSSVFSSGAGRLTGRGVKLAVIDTGVSVHSDLSMPRERIVGFYDFINGEDEPYDDNGHGTFVAGVAAGNGLLSGRKICGVAPECDVIALKAIAGNGESGAFKVLDAMQWLYDNFRREGIKAVCMSFGAEPSEFADPLKLGADMLVGAGLTVVCASGNSGKNGLKSPAVSREVISVGAIDDEYNVAEFSSSGVYQGVARPDVYAKGVRVKGLAAGGAYVMMTGTSMAAPYVAGACCLLHQKYAALSPRQTKNAILNSCFMQNGVKIFELRN